MYESGVIDELIPREDQWWGYSDNTRQTERRYKGGPTEWVVKSGLKIAWAVIFSPKLSVPAGYNDDSRVTSVHQTFRCIHM